MMEDEDLGIPVPLQFPQPLLRLPQIPFLRAPAIRQIQILTVAVEARTAAEILRRMAVVATTQIPIRTLQVDQLGVVAEIHQLDMVNVVALLHQVPVSMIC